MGRRNQDKPVYKRPRIPNSRNGEIMGVVTEIFGGGRMRVVADDGEEYMGIIRGKLKKRMWVRRGDLVLIVPWEFESDRKGKLPKSHIIWRYTRTQTTWLKNHNVIKKEFLDELHNI